MVVLRSLKEIISINIKTRHDSACDQFTRLFMTKILFISAILMGYEYFKDKIYCIHSSTSTVDKNFVNSACWISGFFVYEEMTNRMSESSHYGIPYDVNNNGVKADNSLCRTHTKRGDKVTSCRAMTRIMYVQYQWMPFYIGILGVLFYAPYIVFRFVNVDLISLKSNLKLATRDADQLVKNYFNYKINPLSRLRLRVFFNLVVKLLYIGVNLFAFYFTDYVLYGKFVNYGRNYLKWARKETARVHPSIKRIPRPGDILLPSMGFCEIEEASNHNTDDRYNRYLFLCEFSTNVLYQYVLIMLWILFLMSFGISLLGLLSEIAGHVFSSVCYAFGSPKNAIYRHLSLREIEYLRFIEKKDLVLYGDVVRNLKQQRADKFCDGFDTTMVAPTLKRKRQKPSAPTSVELINFRLY